MSGTQRARIGRIAAVILAIALVAVLAGCGSSPSAPAGGSTAPAPSAGGSGPSGGAVTISEANFAFSPATATAKVGDTVTFTNKDSVPHEVKIDGKDLGQQAPGASVTWTATKAGSFPFSCVIHPNMTGTITVQ